MEDITVPKLRDRLDDLLDRVETGETGETIRISRDGQPIAEVRPVKAPRFTMEEILQAAKDLPAIDLEEFRADLDAILDPYR